MKTEVNTMPASQPNGIIQTYNALENLDGAALASWIKLNWRSMVGALDVKASSKRVYGSHIANFVEWLDVVDVNTVRNYKSFVMEQNISAKTKAYRIAAVKVLFSELKDQYRVLPVDIGKGVKLPKYAKGHVKNGLTHDESKRVMEYIKGINGADRSRLNAMFYLLAFQALRQKEVSRLRVEDVDFSSAVARVDGKTGADQMIFLLPVTVKALRAYIEDSGIKSGYLFRNRSNSAKGNVPISPRSIRRIFMQIFKTLDIDKTVHGFRHFCITHLISLGFSLDEVMQFARISDVNTIKSYNDRVNNMETVRQIASKFTL